MNPDAFRHLPGLRDCVVHPEESQLRVTQEVLAFWDERARGLGRPTDWRLTDQQIEDSRCALLGNCRDGVDVWVFGYGSLMWDPGFYFSEVRLAELEGYQRRFSFRTNVGRGTPEFPGLMMSLEARPGRCKGLAFRISGDIAEHECTIVWRREMIRGSYGPLLLPVSTTDGEVQALVFGPNLSHADHVGELPLDETAAIIARAAGVLGPNRQYLEQLMLQLDKLGIEDAYLQSLLDRVRAIPVESGDP